MRNFFLHFRQVTMGSRKALTWPDASNTLAGVIMEDSISMMFRGLMKNSLNFSSILRLSVEPNDP